MASSSLYVLVFRDEPLIKVGISMDILRRSEELGFHRFDFRSSLSVSSVSSTATGALEMYLGSLFFEKICTPATLLVSGNTEVYPVAILPDIISSIQWMVNHFPQRNYQIIYDLTSLHGGISKDKKARLYEDPPRPFQSVLWDCLPKIERLKKTGLTWKEITTILEHENGLSVTMSTVFNFYKRYCSRTRPLPYGVRKLIEEQKPKPKKRFDSFRVDKSDFTLNPSTD